MSYIETPRDRVLMAAGVLTGRIQTLFEEQPPFVAMYFAVQMIRADPEFVLGLFDQFEQMPNLPLPRTFEPEARRAVALLKAIMAGELDATANAFGEAIYGPRPR